MRKGRFGESQIIAILKEVEGAATVTEVRRRHGIRRRPTTDGWPIPDVPRKMAELIPHARLTDAMRDPVERSYSHDVQRWSKELHGREPFGSAF